MISRALSYKNGKECVFALRRLGGTDALQGTKEIWEHIKRKRFVLDAVDYTVLLKCCKGPTFWSIGNDIIQHIREGSPSLKMDIILMTAMVNMFVKCGQSKHAIDLWDESIKPDRVMYMSFLMACTDAKRIDVGRRIYEHMDKHKFYAEPTVLSCLLKMYTKCDEPHQVWHIWNSLVQAKVRPDIPLYTLLLTACADWTKQTELSSEGATIDSNEPIFRIRDLGSKIHSHILRHSVRLDSILCNSIINMYTRSGQPHKALEVWQDMREKNINPNHATFTLVLLSCGEAAAIQQGHEVHQLIIDSGIKIDKILGTALVNMYAKAGSVDDANKVFDEMLTSVEIDITAWNAILDAYSSQGDWGKCNEVFDSIVQHNIQPDEISFTHLLTAVSHSGKVDIAISLYADMSSKYAVTPNLTHKTIMVDVLARSGRLKEAYEFIKSDIETPNIVTWRTLLGGCRFHNEVEWAEYAASKALTLNPTSAAVYVLLSNVYAAAGRWQDRQRVRDEMAKNGIHKIPGYSQIEIFGRTHTFVMRDETHPEMTAIHQKIQEMHRDLEKTGFKPDTSWVLQNINEEEKEEDLCFHSEKLAMAYGLLHTPPKSKLVITNNLRICGNCHNSTKIFSKLYKRDIIVRDATRFHHFHNDKCSCGDFW